MPETPKPAVLPAALALAAPAALAAPGAEISTQRLPSFRMDDDI